MNINQKSLRSSRRVYLPTFLAIAASILCMRAEAGEIARFDPARILLPEVIARHLPTRNPAAEATAPRLRAGFAGVGRLQLRAGFAGVGGLGLLTGFEGIGPLRASYSIVAPQPSRQEPPRPRGGVFNSVPIAFGALPAKRRWQSAYAQIERAADIACADHCPAGAEALFATVEAARGASLRDKLAVVNRAINDFVTYVPDRRNYGQLDHWASPEQTLRRRRGDCEDYAILKMAALASLGVPSTSMSLVVLLDRRREVYHAVLAVSTSDGHFILDNLARSVRRDTELTDYQPLFSFSTDRSWIHGQTKDTRLAAVPVKLSTQISPGEGPADAEAQRQTPVGKGLLARI